MKMRVFLPILALLAVAQAAHAAPVYSALGASDANGDGASAYPSQPNGGYVFLLENWLSHREAGWTLKNHGINGAQVTDIQTKEVDAAIAENPDLVTLWAGPNDIVGSAFFGETTATLLARFRPAFTDIVQRLRSQTNAYIVVCNVGDLSRIPAAAAFNDASKQLAHDDTVAVNGVIADVAAQYHIPVVDLFDDPTSYDPTNFSGDGFHPNDQGYVLIFGHYVRIILGDVDGDGVLTPADAALVLSNAGGLVALNDRQHVSADASPPAGSGTVDMADATQILRRFLNLVPDSDWR